MRRYNKAKLSTPRAGGGGGTALCLMVSSSSVNQDGRSSSLTAPNGPSQQALIGIALEVGGLYPNDVNVLQMHGTGTSLGDPIEIGAASDALIQGTRDAALVLNAVKSHVGHGETAAGLMGIWQAAAGLSSLRSFPMLHLRSLNPYVASTFDRIAGGARSVVHCPMQLTPLSSGLLGGAGGDDEGSYPTTGISSFAFQGTNAHLLVAAPATHAAAVDARRNTGRLWDAEWQWVTPSCHPLLDHGAIVLPPGGSSITYQAMVSGAQRPGSAQFLDHRVNGRALFPGAGFLELADAALNFGRAGSSTSGMSANGVNAPARLGDVTIPAPLILDAFRGGRHEVATAALSVAIDAASGAFEVMSSGARGSLMTHLHGCAVNAAHGVDSPLQINNGVGAGYGPVLEWSFGAEAAVGHAGGGAAAYASMVNGVDDDANGMWMHPAALDGSLQLGFCVSAAAAASKALVPVGAKLYQGPRTASRSGAPMATSVRQYAHGGASDTASESAHAVCNATGGASHAGLHGLQSRIIGAAAPPAKLVAEVSALVKEAAPVDDVTYSLSWSATAVAAASAAAGRSAMPTTMAESCARGVPHSQRVEHGITGIAALQAMSTFSGNALSMELQTHGAVNGATCGGGSGGDGIDSESLRGAWRVAAGELQSSAVLSTVDVAPATALYKGAASHDAVGVGGHGVAVQGNGLFTSSVRAVLSAAAAGHPSPATSGGLRRFVSNLLLGSSPSALEDKAPSTAGAGAGTGAILTGGGGGLGGVVQS